MKKYIILFAVLFPGFLSAQEKPMKFSFEQFEAWMKPLKLYAIPFTETGKNGEEFMATFVKDNQMIGVTMSPVKSFEDYKKFKDAKPYIRKGHRTVFYGTQNFWNIMVEAGNINACFQVTSVYLNLKKEDLEKILDETGIYDK